MSRNEVDLIHFIFTKRYVIIYLTFQDLSNNISTKLFKYKN